MNLDCETPNAFTAAGLYRFVEERVRAGRIDPRGFWRLARALDHVPRPVAATPATRDERPRLKVRPIPFGRAAAFTAAHHRHLNAPIGHVFSLGVFTASNVLCGVAIVGRPVARRLDDKATLEVTRVAADGTRNACSALLAATRREARRRGFERLVTYTMAGEGGASLRAAGFVQDGRAGGGSWSRSRRPRMQRAPTSQKQRWMSSKRSSA